MARYASARRDLVWAGLGITALGLVLAAYAVTGDRIYDLTWAPIFVLGAAVALAGAGVAAWGRTGARTRAEPLLPLEDEEQEEDEGEAEPEPAPAGDLDDTSGPREVVVIDCPECGTRFREEGVRPFRAGCPDCGLLGRIPAEPPGA
jgi:hypothetical protein